MARPRFQPTDELRRQVKKLAALGLRQLEIAHFVGLRSVKTLRRHFRNELDRGGIEVDVNVLNTLYKMATSGTCIAATIFWLKSRRQMSTQVEPVPAPPPPQRPVRFIINVQDSEPIPGAVNGPYDHRPYDQIEASAPDVQIVPSDEPSQATVGLYDPHADLLEQAKPSGQASIFPRKTSPE